MRPPCPPMHLIRDLLLVCTLDGHSMLPALGLAYLSPTLTPSSPHLVRASGVKIVTLHSCRDGGY